MIPEYVVLDYLKIEAGDPVAPVVIETADRVLTWLETETGRHFREVREWRLRYDGGAETLWLPELPVMDGESEPAPMVTVAQKVGGVWEEIPSTDYELLEAVNVVGPYPLAHESVWPGGRRGLLVTLTAGYEPGALPGDVVQVVLELTAHRHKERGSEGLRSETIGGYSYTRADLSEEDGVRHHWDRVLSRWRHAVFA